MNIVFIHSTLPSDQNSVELRCQNLIDAFLNSGWHQASAIDLESFNASMIGSQPNPCQAADILVIHRFASRPIAQAIQYWKARGKKIIIDMDQPLALHAALCPANDAADLEPCDDTIRYTLRMADLITVNSPRLADDYIAFAPAAYLPDYLNLDRYLTLRQEHEGEIRIGVNLDLSQGSLSHLDALSDALAQVCQFYPQIRVHLPLAHPAPQLASRLPDKQVVLHNDFNRETWPRQLASLDLGLAPANAEEGTRCGRKSVLEYMAVKVPWIASDVQPFRELRGFGWLVQNSPQAWTHALLEVVRHLEAYRREAAGEAFLYALGQDARENIDKITAIYTGVL